MEKSADEISHWPEYDYVIVNRRSRQHRRSQIKRSWRPSALKRERAHRPGRIRQRLRGRLTVPAIAYARARAANCRDRQILGALGRRRCRPPPEAGRVASPKRFERGAQHLPALTESGGDDAFEVAARARRQRLGARHELHQGRCRPWAAARTPWREMSNSRSRLGAPLRHHRRDGRNPCRRARAARRSATSFWNISVSDFIGVDAWRANRATAASRYCKAGWRRSCAAPAPRSRRIDLERVAFDDRRAGRERRRAVPPAPSTARGVALDGGDVLRRRPAAARASGRPGRGRSR